MRWFALGGNVGFALGPLLLTPLLVLFGSRGTLFILIPASITALVVLRELPRLKTFASRKVVKAGAEGRDRWGPFGVLTTFVVLRSMAYIGLVAFVPLYFIGTLHASKPLANVALTCFLIAGACGTIYGGKLADRLGRRTILISSTLASAPLLLAFVVLTPSHANYLGAIAGIMTVGFALVASQTAFVVLGQEYLPNRIGIASGVTLGLAISLGGAGAPVLGALADRFGVQAALQAIVGLLVLAALSSMFLPRERERAGVSVIQGNRAAAALRT